MDFMLSCNAGLQKSAAGRVKRLQKSPKTLQGQKISYRNRKNRYWKTKKLTGKGKWATGMSFPGIA
jgi:hypothetical protein